MSGKKYELLDSENWDVVEFIKYDRNSERPLHIYLRVDDEDHTATVFTAGDEYDPILPSHVHKFELCGYTDFSQFPQYFHDVITPLLVAGDYEGVQAAIYDAPEIGSRVYPSIADDYDDDIGFILVDPSIDITDLDLADDEAVDGMVEQLTYDTIYVQTRKSMIRELEYLKYLAIDYVLDEYREGGDGHLKTIVQNEHGKLAALHTTPDQLPRFKFVADAIWWTLREDGEQTPSNGLYDIVFTADMAKHISPQLAYVCILLNCLPSKLPKEILASICGDSWEN